MDREALNRLRCTPPPGEDEREHFMECPSCHQWFDCRELGDVLHHNEPEHEPLPAQ